MQPTKHPTENIFVCCGYERELSYRRDDDLLKHKLQIGAIVPKAEPTIISSAPARLWPTYADSGRRGYPGATLTDIGESEGQRLMQRILNGRAFFF